MALGCEAAGDRELGGRAAGDRELGCEAADEPGGERGVVGGGGEVLDGAGGAGDEMGGATAAAERTTSAILDCELCAIDEASGEVLPFQSLAARPRKAPTAEQLAAGPRVCLFAFDLLEHNGESLLRTPLRERRARLHALLRPVEHRVALARGVEATSEDEMREVRGQKPSTWRRDRPSHRPSH